MNDEKSPGCGAFLAIVAFGPFVLVPVFLARAVAKLFRLIVGKS